MLVLRVFGTLVLTFLFFLLIGVVAQKNNDDKTVKFCAWIMTVLAAMSFACLYILIWQ